MIDITEFCKPIHPFERTDTDQERTERLVAQLLGKHSERILRICFTLGDTQNASEMTIDGQYTVVEPALPRLTTSQETHDETHHNQPAGTSN